MKKRFLAALLACSVLGTLSVPAASAVGFDITDVSVAEEEDHDKLSSFQIDPETLQETEDKGYSSKDVKYDKATGFYYYIDTKSNCAIVHGNPNVKYNNPDTTTKTINIPSKIAGYEVKKIGDWGFEYYTALTNVVMPDTVLEIGTGSFEKCYSLQSVTFSKKLVHISVAAFQDCVTLTKADLPDSIQTLYSEIFDGCTSLTTIHMPASLRYLSSRWYCKGCPNLKTITFSSSIALQTDVDEINGKLDSAELYIPPTITNITVAGGGKLKTNPYVNYNGVVTRNLVVACVKDSYAHKWAVENNLTVDLIDPSTIDTSYKNVNWNAYAGDVDKNGTIDALDASAVLTAYANAAVGKDAGLDSKQKKAADVNADGNIDALDASAILSYYAYKATGGTQTIQLYFYNK